MLILCVSDAYRVPGSSRQYVHCSTTISIVVHTWEAETADMFIERVTHEIGKGRRVRVATSDGMEQVIISGPWCLRSSCPHVP